MDTASPLPLRLTLHPLLPLRAPEPGESTLTFGFRPRLAGGPGLATDDPLLQAFGGKVLPVQTSSEDRETLQDEAFDPGRRLTLAQQGVDDDGDALVAVWDAEGVRRAGFVPYPASAAVAAGLDHGLAMEAIVLTEERASLDDRRLTVEVLVCARQVVRVDHEVPAAELARPRRRRRARVVLLADGSSELRWWDPTGAAGPMAIGELPLSAELARELQRLSSAYKRAAAAGEEPPEDLVDGIDRDYTRATLDVRTRELWHRARRELGQRYAIGLLAPGWPGRRGRPRRSRTTTATTSRSERTPADRDRRDHHPVRARDRALPRARAPGADRGAAEDELARLADPGVRGRARPARHWPSVASSALFFASSAASLAFLSASLAASFALFSASPAASFALPAASSP